MGQLGLGKGREGGQRLTSKDRFDGKGEQSSQGQQIKLAKSTSYDGCGSWVNATGRSGRDILVNATGRSGPGISVADREIKPRSIGQCNKEIRLRNSGQHNREIRLRNFGQCERETRSRNLGQRGGCKNQLIKRGGARQGEGVS